MSLIDTLFALITSNTENISTVQTRTQAAAGRLNRPPSGIDLGYHE